MSKTDDSTISVVIPTLGGDFLHLTIEQLYRGTVRPTEVLVCIPPKGALRAEVLRIPGVRVVVTEVRGQVAQRAKGFQEATSELVLQLDDDIQLEPDCLERIVSFLEQVGPSNAVGPVYLDADTGKCVHRINGGLTGWLQSVYAMIICGAPWGWQEWAEPLQSGLAMASTGTIAAASPQLKRTGCQAAACSVTEAICSWSPSSRFPVRPIAKTISTPCCAKRRASAIGLCLMRVVRSRSRKVTFRMQPGVAQRWLGATARN